jgi:hypothetical protein
MLGQYKEGGAAMSFQMIGVEGFTIAEWLVEEVGLFAGDHVPEGLELEPAGLGRA